MWFWLLNSKNYVLAVCEKFSVCDGENARSTRYFVRHTLVLAYKHTTARYTLNDRP